MKKFKFFVFYRDGRDDQTITYYDVMPSLYGSIFNSDGSISKTRFHIYHEKTLKRKEIRTKSDLREYIDFHFRYCYRGKCEWECVVNDWPPHDDVPYGRIDVYDQLKPNIDLITNLVWEQVKNKIKNEKV